MFEQGPWKVGCPLPLLLLLAFFAHPLYALPAAQRLTDDAAVYPLQQHLLRAHDTGADWNVDDARAALARGEFRAVNEERSNLGYRGGAIWLFFRLQPGAGHGGRWLLALEYALLDDVRLYPVLIDPTAASRLPAAPVELRGGDHLPFDSRALPIRHLNFALDLQPGIAHGFLLRVQTQSSMQVPLVVARPATYLAATQAGQLTLGLYYGLLMALTLYNLMLFVALRERVFLWYVLYAACFALTLWCLNGFGFQYFWPDSPRWANLVIPLGIASGMLFMLQFTRSFLDLQRHFPEGDLLLRAVMLLTALLLPGAFLLPYSLEIQALTLLVFLVAAVIFGCALVCRRRYPPARYFLVSWTILLSGTIVYACVSLGLLPKVPLTEYSMQIGSAAEMILLSFAMAYRINLVKEENERLGRHTRDMLEARVAERTAELDATARRLQQANRQLQDFTRRDGLTGSYNRRHFDSALHAAVDDTRAAGRPLSLLMLDFDHFKRINDDLGHLAGDDCLRKVAQVMDQRVRAAGGIFARFGGEEFAALLPGLQIEEALLLAQALRREIASAPVEVDGRPIEVTVSIGLCAWPVGHSQPAEELLRAADTALLQAKRAGRDRVEVAAQPTA